MTDFNEQIRLHETQTDWPHQEQAVCCYRFHDLFNAAFFDNSLPAIFLRFEKDHIRSLGRYRTGCNGVGTRYEMTLNIKNLQRPQHELLGAFLHGLIHVWQEIYGKPGKTHNRQFCEMASRLGIPNGDRFRCDCRSYEKPFVSLLAEQGIALETGVAPRSQQGQSKLKKWICTPGCTNIRAAVEVKATCNQCHQVFVRA